MSRIEERVVRVLVVDDHELVREGVRAVLDLEDDLEVVGESSKAAGTPALVQELLPDVVLLDVRLPDGDGVELCREIRSAHPEVHCLIFTAYPGEGAMADAILAGASGLIMKSGPAGDLLASIRAAAAGRSLLDPALTSELMTRLREETGAGGRLSQQEWRVLDLVAEGLTNRQIAERLERSEKTVRNHLSRILSKLGAENRTQAALFRLGRWEPRRRT